MNALLAGLLTFVSLMLWPGVGGRAGAGVLPGGRFLREGSPLSGTRRRVDPGQAAASRRSPPVGRASPRRREARAISEVLDLLDAVAPALRAGLPPAVAVRSATDDGDGARSGWVGELRDAALAGLPLSPVWRRHAAHTAIPEVGLVAQAWALSETAGAPLAEAVELAAELVRDRVAWRRRVDVNTAGPQATMNVLSLLPLTGPVLGLLFGVGPAEMYAGSMPVVASTALGVGLIAGGRWWCRRMIRGLRRPRPVT